MRMLALICILIASTNHLYADVTLEQVRDSYFETLERVRPAIIQSNERKIELTLSLFNDIRKRFRTSNKRPAQSTRIFDPSGDGVVESDAFIRLNEMIWFELKNGKASYVGSSRTDQKKALDIVKSRLKELRKGDINELYSVYLADDFREGAVGKLRYNYIVQQVIDQDSILIRNGQGTVIVHGISTKGMVDDEVFPFNDMLVVTGTETYATVLGGSNTVVAMRGMTDEELKACVEKAMAELPLPSSSRTWTSADSKFSVKAEVVSVSEDSVVLKKVDGKEIKVELQKLSKSDRELLESY